MPDPVLVDTDVVSFLFKGHLLAPAYQELLVDKNSLISLATIGEIEFGMLAAAWGEGRRNRMQQFLERFTILAPDTETARLWALVRFQAQRRGRPIAPMDAWIAATALEFGLPLVTHNTSDYRYIEKLVLLSV